MTLRRRLVLTLAPLAALVLVVGTAGVALLDDLGRRSEAILRDNYASLGAMANLHGNLTDAERTILFAELQGDRLHPDVPVAFRQCLDRARAECRVELGNITVPGEREEADRLAAQVEVVAARGEAILAAPAALRHDLYVDPERGFQQAVTAAWRHLQAIRAMNEGAMVEADRAASATARRSAWLLAGATLAALAVTGLLALRTTRILLRPIDDLTRSAKAVGDGRFDQRVTADTKDEIGELVAAFNRMTVQLKDLKQSQTNRLLRAQRAGQAAIDSFPDPILVIDPDGRVEMANPAARRILGVVPGGDPAAPAWQAPDGLRGHLEAALHDQRAYVTQSFRDAITYRIGGEDRIFVPQVLPVRDPGGNTLGAAVVLSDVTRFRLLDEFKSDLVATASHELKTPLAGLRLAVHLLLEETVGPLTEKQAELLIDARDNTERLVLIVDHLLSLARLEQGREPVALRSEDARALLRAAAERIRPMAAGKRIVVDLDPAAALPPVAADAQRLGRALDNLLVNAATYTEVGGTITLSARAVEGGKIELSVRDTGVGIAPEHLAHVFDKFFRIPGQTRGQGTGLGLAIVKEVVAAHGGEIDCDSEPGRGTTFRMRIPVWTADRTDEGSG